MDENSADKWTNLLSAEDNGLNAKMNEFKDFLSQIVFKITLLEVENHKLTVEKRELLTEVQKLKNDNKEVSVYMRENDMLQTEISSLNDEKAFLIEERDNMKSELMELRNENDMLRSELGKSNLLARKVEEFMRNVMPSENVNGIVNSLPAFSEQMVLTDRPNSLTTFGSLINMNGMRLRPSESKEETYHSTKLASGQTSNETYYDAIGSHRSSLTNGSTGVRPKVQQNHVSSTVPPLVPIPKTVTEVLNDSTLSGLTESTNYYIDQNNNLRLKSVKVPIGRLMGVAMAFYITPSNFWLQTKPTDVNDYFHTIQVHQSQLKKKPNSNLTAADIELGMYCAAIFSNDGYWYRAQIIDITYDHPIERDSIKSVRVLYIDWGNTEERLLSQVMKLALGLNARRQALNCYIQGCGQRSKWNEEAIKNFELLLKDKVLKATFSRPHKVDEQLDSNIYPIDLMFVSENDSTVNVIDFLTIPEEDIPEEPNNKSGSLPNGLKEKSAETVVCNGRLNGHSNPTLSSTQSKSGSKKKLLEIKSKSNQNCANNVVPESAPKTNPVPKSMPHLNGLPSSDANLSDSLRIPPPIIPDTNEDMGLIVEISHLESPSYLYLHIRDSQVGSAQHEDMEEQLNAFYSKYKSHALTQPKEVEEGSFWVNCFSRDERWYRCRVLQKAENKALVNYIDWGNEEWIEMKALMPLTRQLAIYPAMAVRCRLSNLFPIESDHWSEESLTYFQNLIANDSEPPLTAFIAQKPENFDFESCLEVFLWTLDANSEDVLVNLQLVINNFAITDNQEWVREAERGVREKTPPEELMSELIPIINNGNTEIINGFRTSSPKLTTVCTPVECEPSDVINCEAVSKTSTVPNGYIPNVNKSTNGVRILPESPDTDEDEEWDPMADEAACDRNNYKHNPNDAGIATLGFQVKPRLTCKYYDTPQGCRAGDYCSFLHVASDKRFALNDEEEEMTQIQELNLSVGSVVLFELTSVVSPYCFYGVLPWGPTDLNNPELTEDRVRPEESQYNTELEKLSHYLKNKYSKISNEENLNVFPAIGTLVAFRDESDDTYYRGRVVDHNFDHKICTLFAVDLGHELEVKRNQIFKLGKFFCHNFPALAIQCSITGIQPQNPSGWSQQSVDAFTEWLTGKPVMAHILYGKTEGKHYIELIDREENSETEHRISDKLVEYKFAQRDQSSPLMTNSSDEIYNSDSDLSGSHLK